MENAELDLKAVDLDKFAVDVAVVEGHKVTNLPNERTDFISKWHDIRSQRSVNSNELVDRESEEKVTFIRGLAGIGKTMLAKQIALDWAKGKMFEDFSHLYVLECRNLNNERRLDDLLKREFFGDSFPEGNKILFIIDGIDEFDELETKLKDKNSIIYQLLSDRFVGSKVILTGRPHVQTALKSRKVVDLIGNMKIYEIIGLSEKSVNEYIDLFTEKESKKEEAIRKTRNSSQNISRLMSIPQYLNTLCCIAILTEGQAISNTTELYLWLLFLFFKSHIEDIREISEIFSKYFDFIKIFGRISYELLLKKTIIFKKKDFTNEFKQLDENEEMKKIFEVFCIEISGIQSVQKFQFKHLTLQEFFASLYCVIEQIDPDVLINNNNFEIVTFICGFYGGMLKTDGEESMINIVGECLENRGKGEEKQGSFLFRVLEALKRQEEDEEIRVGRAFVFTSEYMNPRCKYADNQLAKSTFSQLADIVPPNDYSNGLRRFRFQSLSPAMDQSMFKKILETAERNDSLREFRIVYLRLYELLEFDLCRYFKCFGFVSVEVYDLVSADKLNLFFSSSIYCNKIGLFNCKVEGNCLKELKDAMETKEDQSRLEQLDLNDCEFDERNWTDSIEIITKIKKVVLSVIAMENSRWNDLVDKIENKSRSEILKLEWLEFEDCNIDDELVKRVRRFNYFSFHEECTTSVNSLVLEMI